MGAAQSRSGPVWLEELYCVGSNTGSTAGHPNHQTRHKTQDISHLSTEQFVQPSLRLRDLRLEFSGRVPLLRVPAALSHTLTRTHVGGLYHTYT